MEGSRCAQGVLSSLKPGTLGFTTTAPKLTSEATALGSTIPEGYGQWRPITGNELESDRSQNRRVEMMITGKDLEDVMGDSLNQYYTITGHDQPEDAVTRYYTSQTAAD